MRKWSKLIVIFDKLSDEPPRYDAKIILGEFNSKVGYDPELRKESNDNGRRLTGFALSRGLVVSSTTFSH